MAIELAHPTPALSPGGRPTADREGAERAPRPRAAVDLAFSSGDASAAPSPELCRLLNAAVIDPDFGTVLLSAPLRGAARAGLAPGAAFGCMLPDPELQLAPIRLAESDWQLVRELSPARTLAALWQHLLRGKAPARGFPVARERVPCLTPDAPGVRLSCLPADTGPVGRGFPEWPAAG